MIEQILNMLRLDKHYNVHEFVEVAKGKYKIPTSVKEVFEQHRRQKNFKK
jgi:hypothetical protein